MLLAVNVALGETSGIVVPETALIQSGAESAVYVIDDAETARRVSVQIGRRLPGAVEIRRGLSPGDRVVTNGQLTLRPGVVVREANPGLTQLSKAPGQE
jgi:membrane fusion protein (multidrug efflux system)